MIRTPGATRRLSGAVTCAVICAVVAVQAQTARSTLGTFGFLEERSRAFELPLTGAGDSLEGSWPDTATVAWDTAMLGVEVAAATDAPAPFVEVTAGSATERHYFRPGDAGPRWLNLSALRGATSVGTPVRLRGDGVRLAPGRAILRVFANALDLSRRPLVLAPHPDDAEIAAFGLYVKRNATVVTITTDNAGPPSDDAVSDDAPQLYAFKGRIRLIDSITVPWLGGIPPERAFNMGYFDARLAEIHDRPTAVIPELYGPNTDLGAYLPYNIGSLLPKGRRASSWSNLVDDLVTVLKKVEPAIILAPHPQLDAHRDHQFTTVALSQALARWRRRATLLLYTNHADLSRYPCGPAGTVVSLPPPVAQDVQFDRLYSHPVPPDLQRLKLFALESMHDLRLSPSRLYQLLIGDGRTTEPEAFDPPGGVPLPSPRPAVERAVLRLRRTERHADGRVVPDRLAWPRDAMTSTCSDREAAGMTTSTSDKAFTGSVPHAYETHLVPLLFAEYADDMVRRVAAAAPARVLEIACGAGVVTRRLAAALPAASIVATDLNQAMIDEAAAVGTPRPVEWRQADAAALPFADGAFDVVVCQFGVMFFPDKARAHAEVHRVLAPGGLYVFSVWDELDANEFADLVHEAVATVFPENPPRFLARAPYGYFDLEVVRRDLAAGGFAAPSDIETVALRSQAPSPRGPAVGYCQGSPLRAEIEASDPRRLALATDTAAEAIAQRFGRGAVEAGIRAHVVAVRR